MIMFVFYLFIITFSSYNNSVLRKFFQEMDGVVKTT